MLFFEAHLFTGIAKVDREWIIGSPAVKHRSVMDMGERIALTGPQLPMAFSPCAPGRTEAL